MPTRRQVLLGMGSCVSYVALEGILDGILGGALADDAWTLPLAGSGTRTPAIHPHSAWAGRHHPPVGLLWPERDVRFLVVHHSLDPGNRYSRSRVRAMIRRMYYFHTGPRGWPDIAYNFCVDRYGGIWEARAGSLAGPVQGDARFGSQGFDQKVCWIGDLREVPPTPAAITSMVSLLAWLARRYGIDPAPGAQVRFVSRGSNRYAAGTVVTARTIEVHRWLSRTGCPGDAGYRVAREVLPGRVARLVRDTRL